MTLYGYARVSVREPEDKNLDLQVDRLVRAGCSLGNIRAEEASGARNDRGGLLELLDLVVEGDTLVVSHIDRLSRGADPRAAGDRGPAPDGSGVPVPVGRLRHGHGHRQVPAHDGAGLQRVVAELDPGVLGRGAGEGAGRGSFPWAAAEPERAATGVHPGRAQVAVLVAGLAAAAAGTISVATGAFLGSRAELDVQRAEIAKEARELEENHGEEYAELVVAFQREGKSYEEARAMADEIAQDKDLWLRTMAEKELGISFEETTSPVKDALVMGLSFIIAALLPIIPHLFLTGYMAISVPSPPRWLASSPSGPSRVGWSASPRSCKDWKSWA